MRYKIVTNTDVVEFNRLCTDLMTQAYTPIGGISVILGPGDNYTRYTQAFIG